MAPISTNSSMEGRSPYENSIPVDGWVGRIARFSDRRERCKPSTIRGSSRRRRWRRGGQSHRAQVVMLERQRAHTRAGGKADRVAHGTRFGCDRGSAAPGARDKRRRPDPPGDRARPKLAQFAEEMRREVRARLQRRTPADWLWALSEPCGIDAQQYNQNDRCLPSRRRRGLAFSKVRVRGPRCGAPIASTTIRHRPSSACSVDLA